MREEIYTLSGSICSTLHHQAIILRHMKRSYSSLRRVITLALMSLVWLALMTPHQIAQAQPSKTRRASSASAKRSPKPKPSGAAQSSSQSSSGGKVIEFKQLRLEGNIQRPSAAYFVQRKRLKFKGLVPKRSFISKIRKSVTKAPF